MKTSIFEKLAYGAVLICVACAITFFVCLALSAAHATYVEFAR